MIFEKKKKNEEKETKSLRKCKRFVDTPKLLLCRACSKHEMVTVMIFAQGLHPLSAHLSADDITFGATRLFPIRRVFLNVADEFSLHLFFFFFLNLKAAPDGSFVDWHISQNALQPGFLSDRRNEATMGGTSCYHQPMRRKLMQGRLMAKAGHLT